MLSVAGPTLATTQTAAASIEAHAPTPRRPALGNQALLRRLQAKLVVGAVDDPLEHEADAVAAQVVRMPDPGLGVSASSPRISRKCAACEETDKVQTKRADADVAVEEAPAAVDEVLHSPGRSLDAAARSFLEPRFGRSFDQVRVHTDARAAESARSVGARAYTVGRDIVFAEGSYAPGSMAGRQRIAHELTHVAQQDPVSARHDMTATLRRVTAPDQSQTPGADADTPAATPAPTPGTASQPASPPTTTPGTAPAQTGTGTPCADGSVDQDQDPLPSVPAFTYQLMSGAAVFAAITKRDPSITFHPLGASDPVFNPGSLGSVKVSTAPDTGQSCLKCLADWTLPVPAWESLIANDYVTSDESKRFPVIRPGDVSGCPPSSLPSLTEVRVQIPPALIGKIVTAESEHYEDFKRAYQMTGGRYLANVKRLTVERSHLRGKDQAECEAKVGGFLGAAAGGMNTITAAAATAPPYNLKATDVLPALYDQSLRTVYAQSGAIRDKPSGPHHAVGVAPPLSQPPILPNIDTSINPFGCTAYARRYNAASLPGVPGDDAKAVVKDLGDPAKQPWHAL
jgi:hypothetical protein